MNIFIRLTTIILCLCSYRRESCGMLIQKIPFYHKSVGPLGQSRSRMYGCLGTQGAAGVGLNIETAYSRRVDSVLSRPDTGGSML